MGAHRQGNRKRLAILVCLFCFNVLLTFCTVSWLIGINLPREPEIALDDNSIADEPIHLAFVCGGRNSTRGLYTLMKSIIFYRTNSELVLHIFVDDISRRILAKLFNTLVVPNLDVRYHDTIQLMKSVSWIPNDHYSGVYGLIKLVAPLELANLGVKRVIFLDTDMLVLGDIATLHSQFGNRSLWQTEQQCMGTEGKPFIGLVENQSYWYEEVRGASTPSLPWRAHGRGFNTGVMLIDLARLKNSTWENQWRQVAYDELSGGGLKVQLADQDIMNTVIKLNRNFVIKLECQFNLQINDNTDLNESCPGQTRVGASSFRLVHWNSPKKLQTKSIYNDYYKKWYEIIENFSAELMVVRSLPRRDRVRYLLAQSKLPESCDGIRPGLAEELRIFVEYLEFQIDGRDEHDVTLAVHLSFDRMNALDKLAANWPGPISAAIYLRESEISSFHELIQDSNALALRRNIGYHLAFKDHGQSYPINRMRNLALEQTLTPYVYLSDVDFVPAPELYEYLKYTIRDLVNSPNKNTTALIVPVFETREYKFRFPKNKADLLRQLDTGTISKFRETIWPRGQAATQYDTWKQASKPYEVQWEPDYEPFIVTHKDVARYDERFVGFGWNKVEHIMLLAAKGYKFYVLPEAYAIHQYHAASYDMSMYRQSRKYQACARNLKSLFASELHRNYPIFYSTRINATTPSSLVATPG